MWAAHTLQRLNPDGIFVARARLIALTACPVVPAHHIVEAHVELMVLEVALGHEACVAGGMAGGLNEVVKVDCAGGSGGACMPVLVCSSDGVAGGVAAKGAITDEGNVTNEGRVMNEGSINSVYKLQKQPVQRSWRLLVAA